MEILYKVCLVFAIIGAINWAFVGLFELDLVASIFGGSDALLARIIYIIIAIVVLAIIGISLYFVLNSDTTNNTQANTENSINNEITKSEQNTSKSIRNEIVTAENYEELMNKAEQEFSADDEEIYYLSYSIMYYIMTDGMQAAMAGSEDESEMYVNIYGKTVQQLIDEGKQLMEENDISLDEYKSKINDLNELSNSIE